ncbi:hypothetical protein [Paenibacillus sp. 3LSP]|jgi:hypothetical protein|nr:hypothetical protein [Paenibacillus sp. 3LSP]
MDDKVIVNAKMRISFSLAADMPVETAFFIAISLPIDLLTTYCMIE